jgi:NAD-dependent dihydropyrimidine dehydrogenase PreA subunit
MKINKELCIGCQKCVPFCPMGAIHMEGKRAAVDQDECIECGICVRQIECPRKAFYEPEETNRWPRSVRKVFSDPTAKHESTGVRGRGTEEVKTNDVTGRVKRGQIGFALEFGRPAMGCRIRDVEVISKPLAALGIEFEPCNPLTSLLDTSTGIVHSDVRDEKVLSAIIEFCVPEERLEEIARVVYDAAKHCDTVFSWGLVVRYAEDGTIPAVAKLEKMGIRVPRNAKINVGLGRPLMEA